MTEFFGTCGCGAIRFRVCGERSANCICHCNSCRRHSGAPFLAWITFSVDEFQVVEGTLCAHRSSPKAERGFCANCGTTLSYAHDDRPEDIDLTVASFDNPEAFPPVRHIWVSDKLAWVSIDDGLPQFAGWSADG